MRYEKVIGIVIISSLIVVGISAFDDIGGQDRIVISATSETQFCSVWKSPLEGWSWGDHMEFLHNDMDYSGDGIQDGFIAYLDHYSIIGGTYPSIQEAYANGVLAASDFDALVNSDPEISQGSGYWFSQTWL